ncbi:MAG: GTPase [Planctomycetaceae bacterium]
MSAAGTQSPFTAGLLTPAGRGAVATVRIRGGAIPPFHPVGGRDLSQYAIGRVLFGRWGDGAGDGAGEDVVVVRRDLETLDVHCHGGHAAVARILNDLQTAGARIVCGWETAAESLGSFAAECRNAVSLTRTTRTAGLVLEQSGGLLRRCFEELADLAESSPEITSARIDELLRWADFGRHLTNPWRVVVAGRPNVGKSSLVNVLVGFPRAIVFDDAGTTRDVVTVETAFDGWPVELIDTAGLRNTDAALEAAGVERARGAMQAADCRVSVVDVSRPLQDADRELLCEDDRPSVAVANKCDLPAVWDAAGLNVDVEPLAVSSLTGTSIDSLQAAIVERLVPEVPPPGTAIPLTDRQVSLLREARKTFERGDAAAGRAVVLRVLEG